jgi:hypothetical protein
MQVFEGHEHKHSARRFCGFQHGRRAFKLRWLSVIVINNATAAVKLD